MKVREAMEKLLELNLPERGAEGTADPIFIVYDRFIDIPDRAIDKLEEDDRVEYLEDEADWCFKGTYDKYDGDYDRVPDSWFVENGYAQWCQRFYGVFLTREEAQAAIDERRYVFNNPFVYCESLHWSSDLIKQLIKLYYKATEEGIPVGDSQSGYGS